MVRTLRRQARGRNIKAADVAKIGDIVETTCIRHVESSSRIAWCNVLMILPIIFQDYDRRARSEVSRH
jgi:hypothetical protein